ncbi:MAG: OmpA family protein, partial [Aestuariivirga sp.]
ETKLAEADAKTAIAVREQLMQNMKQFAPDQHPTLEVKQTKEGVLISLTDSLNFDMFAVGSAEPSPQLVALMEKVAGTLRDYKGRIVIRGHTDSRPFRNPDYDNWRLSTARAQMAYYMLVRAGVDENSVERIEGYADRNLKFPDEPESAGNRRIEILLKVNQL